MAARSPLLLTGASGMVGSALYRDQLHSFRCTLIGSQSRPPPVRRGDSFHRRDFSTPGAARALVESVEPEVVFHAAAISSVGVCESEPDRSRAVNVAATRELARACAEQGAYLVFCSTDQVFDGECAPYGETAPVSPLTAYGRQKAEAEQVVLEEGRDALVLRLALVLGRSPSGTAGAVDMLRPRPDQGTVGLFEDEWRTPITVGCLGRLVNGLFESRPRGILNAGGADRIQRLALGQEICQAFGWQVSLEGRSRQAMPYPRPEDVSFGLDRRRELGLPLPDPLVEALARLAGEVGKPEGGEQG